MRNIVRFIKRQWHKLETLTPFYMDALGKFRVKYNDGRISRPMDYATAKDYAEMFGGKVIDNF